MPQPPVRSLSAIHVLCPICEGTGYLPTMSKQSDSIIDDLADPIPCYACIDGIAVIREECQAHSTESGAEEPESDLAFAD